MCSLTQMFHERVSSDLWTVMCIVPRSGQNISHIYPSIAAYAARGVSNVLLAVAGALGPPASCNCPRFPSSADMQYHLSKYLDNWIWEGSQSCHYNQCHCQQRHREAASSCTMGPDWVKGWSECIFSWLTEQGSRSQITWLKDFFHPAKEGEGEREGGSKCLQLHIKILKISCPPGRMTKCSLSLLQPEDTKQWISQDSFLKPQYKLCKPSRFHLCPRSHVIQM